MSNNISKVGGFFEAAVDAHMEALDEIKNGTLLFFCKPLLASAVKGIEKLVLANIFIIQGRKKMRKTFVLYLLAVLILAGCAPGVGPKEQGGALLGAGTGALLGSQFGHGHGRLVGVAIGTLAGTVIGQEFGRSLDRADNLAMEQNVQNSLELNRSHETSTWTNPDSGHSGTLTPTQTYQTAQNEYCREYLQTVTIGGEESRAYGTACRETDGAWKVVN